MHPHDGSFCIGFFCLWYHGRMLCCGCAVEWTPAQEDAADGTEWQDDWDDDALDDDFARQLRAELAKAST